MKLLLVHDHVLFENKDGIYSKGSKFTGKSFDRYLDSFQEVHLLMNYVTNEEAVGENLMNSFVRKVDFQSISFIRYNIDIAYRRNIQKLVRNLVNKYDGVCLRMPSKLGMIVGESISSYACEVVADYYEGMKYHNKFYYKYFAKYFDNKIKRVVANSKMSIYVTKEYLQQRYPTDIMYSASNAEVVVDSFKSNFVMKQKYRIGIIGSPENKAKNIKDAIRVQEILQKKGIDNELIVVGKGSIKSENKNVAFLGQKSNDYVMNDFFNSIDIYLQTSLGAEGLPRTIIESLSKGVVAFAYPVDGVPEILDDDQLASDPIELTDKIIDFINLEDKHKVINYYISKIERYNKSNLDPIRKEFWKKYSQSGD